MKTQSFHRTVRAVVVVVVALALLVALSKTYSLWSAHRSAILRAERDTMNAASVLAEHAARTFEGVARTLEAVKDLHRDVTIGATGSMAEAHDALKTIQGTSPVLLGIGWTDAAGNRLASSLYKDPPALNIADQDQFAAHKTSANLGLYLAPPLRSRLDGTWILPVTCRIEDSSGGFAGVISAVLRLDYFLEFYRAVNLGQDTSISLMRSDGVLLVREPMVPGQMGQTVGNLLRGGLPGIVHGPSPIDGRERILAIEPVPSFPLAVSAAMSRADALAPFNEFWFAALGELALILIALGGGGGMLVLLVRRREAAAREAAETTTLLRSVFAVTDQAIIVFDRDLRAVAWNELCAGIFGPALSLGRGAPLESMLRVTAESGEYGAGSVDAMVAERMASARARRPVRYERARPGGGVLDVAWLPLPNGFLVITHTDVTRIKKTELALRESQARVGQAHIRLKDAVDSLSDPFLLWDAEERLVLANRVALTGAGGSALVPGVRLEQVLREQIHAGRFPAAAGREKEFLDQRLAQIRAGSGEVVEIERADGTWLATWDHRTSEGGIVSLLVDITALKRSEKALRDSEARVAREHERLVDALDTLADPFFIWDAEERLIHANNAAAQGPGGASLVPGSRLEDVIRHRVHAGRFPEAAGREEQYVEERLTQVRRAVGEPSERQRADGRWLSIRDFRTREGGYVNLVVDITELKVREAELYEARKAADAASRAKSDFLSRMSHELRTPLNAVIGFSQMMQLEIRDPLTERQRLYCRDIETGGRHLLALVDDVLDLARIESGKEQMSIERVGTEHVLASLRGAMSAIADSAGIGLTVAEPVDVPDLRADDRRLHQILLNLVSNAIKYNREGGSVAVAAERTPQGRVRIVVTDTGIGIPDAYQAELFEPFHRLGQEHSGIDGTGIGLAICKRLAEAMDGAIGFASTHGSGSTFWVELPIYESRTQAAPTPAPAEEASETWAAAPSDFSLLYVEDNPSNMRLMEHLISALPNVTLLQASTPHLGLDLARAHRPDLILLDLHLPGMSGFEMLQHLKAMEETREIPVIALTAAAMPSDIRRGLAAGFSRYLTKPIDVREFLSAIAECIPLGSDDTDETQGRAAD
ncbi:MAG: response regulator [Alphaproteobacteria bacterium]|nr:response regulator [Alphaproteobacteria bacterium]